MNVKNLTFKSGLFRFLLFPLIYLLFSCLRYLLQEDVKRNPWLQLHAKQNIHNTSLEIYKRIICKFVSLRLAAFSCAGIFPLANFLPSFQYYPSQLKIVTMEMWRIFGPQIVFFFFTSHLTYPKYN